MKQIAVLLVMCLLLTGCGWMDGSYSSVTPHKVKDQSPEQEIPVVRNLAQLKTVLGALVDKGAESGSFSVEDFDEAVLDERMASAIEYVLEKHPVGTYALDSVSYELGTAGGVSAVAVSLTYNRSVEEIRAIVPVSGMEQAQERLWQAMRDFAPALVLRVGDYKDLDFVQLVSDFAMENPDVAMELPQVTVSVYPQEGTDRVVDIRFAYQTARDTLYTMRDYVEPVFRSAALYVSSEEESDSVKFARLYTFLKERNDYQVKTSIVPAYSLLRYGVGDSKAFALVYAAMCRRAELDCQVVNGTRNGEPWFWNLICVDETYYHVDVLSFGGFAQLTDAQMGGYVWDYSAYPASK